MAKLTKSIEIEASPEKVFTFTNDLKKRNATREGWAEAKYTSEGPVGVGTTIHYVGVAAGKRAEWDMEIVEFVKNKKTASRIIGAGKSKMADSLTFEPTAKGTTMTFYMEYEVPYSILGKLIDELMVSKDMEKGMSNMLENMKKALET